MNGLQLISRLRGGRVATAPVRKLSALGVSSAEVILRLKRVPGTILGLAEQPDRLRVTPKTAKKIFVFADIALANNTIVVGVEASSLRDGRRNLIKKTMAISCWISLLGLFLLLTGATHSLTNEWTRRQGGTNTAIVSEMARTGLRATSNGFQHSESPMRAIDLIRNDPTLLSTMFASMAIIGALSAGVIRLIPESIWDLLSASFGTPTNEELKEAANNFQEEVLAHLKQGRSSKTQSESDY